MALLHTTSVYMFWLADICEKCRSCPLLLYNKRPIWPFFLFISPKFHSSFYIFYVKTLLIFLTRFTRGLTTIVLFLEKKRRVDLLFTLSCPFFSLFASHINNDIIYYRRSLTFKIDGRNVPLNVWIYKNRQQQQVHVHNNFLSILGLMILMFFFFFFNLHIYRVFQKWVTEF